MALLRRLRERIAFWIWFLTDYRPMAGGAGEETKTTEEEKPSEEEETETEEEAEEVDWEAKARTARTAANRERKARERLAKQLKDRQDADKSEQEKALETAREEAKAEAKAEADKDRRSDRLEVAVTRLATKGITLGEGDDAKTLRFADSEDAQLHIERAIARGEIDEDDIFDDEGKVKTDALQSELEQLLERKPHLAAGEAERPKPKGDPGLRKGTPASNDLEGMTPEDHAKRKYGANK